MSCICSWWLKHSTRWNPSTQLPLQFNSRENMAKAMKVDLSGSPGNITVSFKPHLHYIVKRTLRPNTEFGCVPTVIMYGILSGTAQLSVWSGWSGGKPPVPSRAPTQLNFLCHPYTSDALIWSSQALSEIGLQVWAIIATSLNLGAWWHCAPFTMLTHGDNACYLMPSV